MAFAAVVAIVATILVVQLHEPLIVVGALVLIIGGMLLPIWKRL